MEHGNWRTVAPGVLARRYAELDQTLGLVVGERRCLVIDTGRDHAHGSDFAAAIREVTSLPWTVVITHAHFDHCFGTSAFLPCPVWAHPGCHRAITASAQRQRAEWVARYVSEGKHAFADALAGSSAALPSDTVTDRETLDIGGRDVRLLHVGRGHTDHDVIVHVPDAGVVFAGDLVEQGAPPSVGEDSHLAEWPATLDALLALRPRVIVPGHGDPVDAAFVRRQRAALAERG